ncbi:MAG: preprotein translocase subunit SecE [Clostridia bacterium]|nr:preprotein translocase subunit SecE [Clostridia bacterium]
MLGVRVPPGLPILCRGYSFLKGSFARASKFFREVLAETRKIVWPTRRETAIYTGVVIAAVTLVAVSIWIFDSILGYLLGLLVQF